MIAKQNIKRPNDHSNKTKKRKPEHEERNRRQIEGNLKLYQFFQEFCISEFKSSGELLLIYWNLLTVTEMHRKLYFLQ